MVEKNNDNDFETYMISNLNDSLIRKNEIKSLKFESWWIENQQKNMITVIYRLDGQPHELIIKDTKYFVKEIYLSDKNQNNILTCWDLHVGAKIDIFGKPTILKQCDLKTSEWNKFYGTFLIEIKNTFIEEIKKYERKALDTKLTRSCQGKTQCSINLRELIRQNNLLKQKLSTYRPLLSDDIVVAFESLL